MKYTSLAELQQEKNTPYNGRTYCIKNNNLDIEKLLFQAKNRIDAMEDVVNDEAIIPADLCLDYLKSLYVIESYYKNEFKYAIYQLLEQLDLDVPTNIVLLTEYANIKAKEHDKSCYQIKRFLPFHAYMAGAKIEYSTKDKTFRLYTPETGTVSIHDPNQYVESVFSQQNIVIEQTENPWSGIFRQKQALAILFCPELRQIVAKATARGVMHSAIEKKELNEQIKEQAEQVINAIT